MTYLTAAASAPAFATFGHLADGLAASDMKRVESAATATFALFASAAAAAGAVPRNATPAGPPAFAQGTR